MKILSRVVVVLFFLSAFPTIASEPPEVELISSLNLETRVVQCQGVGKDLKGAMAEARRNCLDGFVHRLMAITHSEREHYKERRQLILQHLEGLVDRPEIIKGKKPERGANRLVSSKRLKSGKIEVVVQVQVHVEKVKSRLGSAVPTSAHGSPQQVVLVHWSTESAEVNLVLHAAAAIESCLTQTGLRIIRKNQNPSLSPDLELTGSVLLEHDKQGKITPGLSVKIQEGDTKILAASSSTVGTGSPRSKMYQETCARLQRQLAAYTRKLTEFGRNYQIRIHNPPKRAIFALHKILKRNTTKVRVESDLHSLLFRVQAKSSLVELQKLVEEGLRAMPGGKSLEIVKRSKRFLEIRVK